MHQSVEGFQRRAGHGVARIFDHQGWGDLIYNHISMRVLDSMQLTAKHKVATPVNGKQGDDVLIVGSVSDEEAKKMFPGGWKAPKACLRITKQPA